MSLYVNINNSTNSETPYDALYGTGKWLTKDGTTTNPYTMVDYTGVLNSTPSGEYLFSGIYVSDSPDPMTFGFGYFKSIGTWGNLPFRIKKINGYIEVFGTTPTGTVSGAILCAEYGIYLYAYNGPPNTLNFFDSVLHNNWYGQFISFGQVYDTYLERVRFSRCSLYGNLNFNNSNRTIELYECFHSGSFEGSTSSITITAQNSTFTTSDFNGRTELNCWGNTFNSAVLPTGTLNLTGSIYNFVTETGVSPLWAYSGYYLYFLPDVPSGASPLSVHFNSYTNVSGMVYTWDTESSTYYTSDITHTYALPGTYQVVLSGDWGSQVYNGYSTYIFDNFSGGAMDSWWNSDATGAFSVVSTVSGNALEYNGTSENMRMLTPYGVHLSGDFDISALFMISGTISSVWPSIGVLTSSGDIGLEGIHWARQNIDLLYEVAEVHVAGSGHVSGMYKCDLESYQTNLGFSPQLTYSGNGSTVGVRLIRDNGVISGYYKDGNGSWTGLSGAINYSGEAVAEINGADWIRCLWISGGADAGFPYYVNEAEVYKKTTSPNWAYLSGYIYDSVSNSGINPLWDSDYQAMVVSDMSGFYSRSTYGWQMRLIPAGYNFISGEFDLQFDFVDDGSTQHTEIELCDSSSGWFEEFSLENNYLEIGNGLSSRITITRTLGKRYTVRTIRGASLSPSGTITIEPITSGIHLYYFDNLSGAGTNTWKEFITSPYTTLPKATGVLFFRTETNLPGSGGFDNLKFQTNSQPGTYNSTYVSDQLIGPWGTQSGNLTFSDYITVYLPSTEITGLVEGEGYVYSEDTYDEFISGLVEGQEKIRGIITFIYPDTDEPPTDSGVIQRSVRPILTNKSRYPYKIPGDTIVSKVDVLKNGRLSYISGIPLELWMNYSGTWTKCEDAVTDRYGSCYITHPTTNIPNINNCLGIVKATYEDGYYISNIMRYNFYSGIFNPDLVYIIDAAATGTVPDRVNHDIFEGSGRLNLFDRMYYI